MTKKKVLVLGGGGFIGAHLCNHLATANYEVRAFGRSASASLDPSVEFLAGDFSDISQLRSALEDQDYVFHLIHGTNPPKVNSDIIGDIQRTIQPTIALLDECSKSKIKRIFFLSSGGTVYGDNGMIASRESDPTIPMNAYGAHKLLIENYLRAFSHSRQQDYLILRLSNPYGPLQNVAKGVGLISTVIDAVRNGRAVDIYGDGETERDYIYIEDAVQAMSATIAYEGSQKIFNIGSGEGKSVNKVVSLVERAMGSKAKKNMLPGRSFDVRKSVLDISLIRHETGWRPSVDLRDGINLTIDNL